MGPEVSVISTTITCNALDLIGEKHNGIVDSWYGSDDWHCSDPGRRGLPRDQRMPRSKHEPQPAAAG